MKKALFAALALVALAINTKAQTPLQGGAQISVNKEFHDYGEIKQGAEPYCQFTIKNTGNAPLIISKAEGSCGCTVPEYSKEPIMPGKSQVIKVRYDTSRLGVINKSVTIMSNAVNEPNLVLRIKGNVNAADSQTQLSPEKKASAAPVYKTN